MYLMTDSVAGAGKVNAVLFGNRLYIAVVVRVFKARLERVVVYVSNRAFRAYALDTHCFEFKVRHGAGCVLRECLIDFN